MSVKSFCDGCTRECGDADLTLVGRYDPVTYCADCHQKWREYKAEEWKLRAGIVASFEARRAELRTKMKADGLGRLPDEG